MDENTRGTGGGDETVGAKVGKRKVNAAVLRAPGEPLSVETVTLEVPGPHQVRVSLAASGVCHSDLSIQNGTLPFMFPTVLGHEGAGVVEAVGSEVTRVRVGDHVVLCWMPACRECFWCRVGQPVLCENGLTEAFTAPYGTLESGEVLIPGLGTATFAEATLVSERSVVKIYERIGLDQAALVGCALSTGIGAVARTAEVPAGSSVAVVGCGGVGLAAIVGARLAGASKIVAVDRVSAKLAIASLIGATDVVDSSSSDPVAAVRAITEGRGVDYAFEVVGRSSTIKQAFQMARRGGTAVIVGAGSADDDVSFSAMDLFVDAKRILGCVYGSVDADRDFPWLVGLIMDGNVDASAFVSRRIGLDDVNDAFKSMEAGEVTRSVIIY